MRMLPVLAVLVAASAQGAAPPWARTEDREPCANYAPLRAPFFGDLHVHTRVSADAYIYGTRVTPREAYAFARGGSVVIPDGNEAQTRSARIDRPLDFSAITDHAEWFGEVELCRTPESSVYDQELCRILRVAEPNFEEEFVHQAMWQVGAGVANIPRPDFCFLPGVDCVASAVSVWQDEQAAAEEAYDRTAACTFTSFIGFENTVSPLGRHLHRNVIFRNAHVPPYAVGALDTGVDKTPQGVWSAIESGCLDAGTGCDALIIPHNPNLSNGEQWLDPADAAEAARRQRLEPLAEIHQIKGNSECRFDRLAGLGAGTADELCTFEQDPSAAQGLFGGPRPIDVYPLRNMIRNTLKDGLVLDERLGVNPFRLGFIGSTDTHNGAPGNASESGWPGGQGNNDASPAIQIHEGMRTNPGGLAVVWAEENSRDALFEALRRRETYATSGTRPVVRFFAGELGPVRCGGRQFVHDAYATGTPMGGEMGPVRGRKSPRFAVWAVKDPGTETAPGTDLQRVQIVKGWVDGDGKPQERVFDVAGTADNGATVDPATCTPQGRGQTELCTVWQDPSFDAGQRAFYYVRLLENPTCRWSTRVCQAAGVDPFAADCGARVATAGEAFADCCLGPTTDAFLDPVVQERAWTSPIWYQPEGIARVQGKLRFGKRAGRDRLGLRVVLGRLPTGWDPGAGLEIEVRDDDTIARVALAPGALRQAGRRWVLADRTGRTDGLRNAAVRVTGGGEAAVTLQLAADLGRAAREEHMVTVLLSAGGRRLTHTRLWRLRGGRLGPGTG